MVFGGNPSGRSVVGDVVVVGGGLSGLAASALLSESGCSVTVVEAREEPAHSTLDPSRSINLALSRRGIQTLDALGITSEVMRSAVPMYGRRIHLPGGGEEFQAYDLVGNQGIQSIRRFDLWQALRAAAESRGVRIQFGARCAGIDFHTRTLTLADRAGRTFSLEYRALLGCDGANSSVRRALVEYGRAEEEAVLLRHGYWELSIPKDRAPGLDRHALHIWPRTDQMLIALPNSDGSFTATLFVPMSGERICPADSPDTNLAEFHETFEDAISLFGDLSGLIKRRASRLAAIKCWPWTDGAAVLLMGDAAHTMAPFYGQGMNCALEDCWILSQVMKDAADDWPRTFTGFDARRRSDTDAITRLSEENYREMSHSVVDTDFALRREIERALQTRFPARFVPLYAMISFSTLPYAEALARGIEQAAIVSRLAAGLERIGDLDLEAEWLTKALASPEKRLSMYGLNF